jgi:hypothetical protein
MARKGLGTQVIGKGDIAMGALHHMTTVLAKLCGMIATAIQEKDGLLSGSEASLNALEKGFAKRRVALIALDLSLHVHDLHSG